MPDINPITKFTLKDWVKHPTTILLIVVTLLAWGVVWLYVNSQLEQVEYHRERVDKLEKQLDNYTTTILTKDGTIKMLTDSLRNMEEKL